MCAEGVCVDAIIVYMFKYAYPIFGTSSVKQAFLLPFTSSCGFKFQFCLAIHQKQNCLTIETEPISSFIWVKWRLKFLYEALDPRSDAFQHIHAHATILYCNKSMRDKSHTSTVLASISNWFSPPSHSRRRHLDFNFRAAINFQRISLDAFKLLFITLTLSGAIFYRFHFLIICSWGELRA